VKADGSLNDKVALVTGGAAGIGSAIVRRLLDGGARVGIADIRPAPDELAVDADRLSFTTTDVRNDAQITEAVATTVQRFGRLDILVNNAGILRFTPLASLARSDWDGVIGVNLTAPAFCAKAALPHLRATGGGSIVNIASIQSVLTGPEFAAYAASKAGLLGLTRSLALELGPSGIRVNAVLPGYIRTELFMSDAERLGEGDPQRFIERLEPDIALRRIGEPSDVAEAVAFLASDAARYVNGAALTVDAGVTVQL
jgi:NAD(P)-dependent dehydrogenase (short-subunit alcohol dehydrogenase family)